MNKMQEQVLEFHKKFDCHIADSPISNIPEEVINLRLELIQEEVEELGDAFDANDGFAIIDALCDLLYVTIGTCIAIGVDIEPFFDEVHRCNMLKEGGGKSELGKILKPDGWVQPDHERIWKETYGI